MPSEEEISNQWELLAVHRRTLATYLHKQALAGGAQATSVGVTNGIVETRVNIVRIKRILREWGRMVEDLPDDEDISKVTPSPMEWAYLRTLRTPTSDFVNRKSQIEELVASIVEAIEKGSMALASIRGVGGSGKTEFAYVVAQRLASHFADGQVLVELHGTTDSPLTTEQALQIIIHSFRPEIQLPNNLSTLQKLYHDVLNGKKIFILADDARDATHVLPLLPPPGCALLITARQRFSLASMVRVDLSPLPSDEAVAWLSILCPRIGNAAEQLVQLCSALPLALRISAGTLANARGLRVTRYLELLANERTALKQWRDPFNSTLDIEASLSVSYKELDEPARDVLEQISVFPTSFDLTAATAIIVPRFDSDLEDLLGQLERWCLLEWDAETERYQIYHPVRVFAASKAANKTQVHLRHARYYAEVAQDAEGLYEQGGDNLFKGLMLFDLERTHINAGWKWVLNQEPSSVTDALLLEYMAATASIGNIRYSPADRIAQLSAALYAAARLNLPVIQGPLFNNLGGAYASIGDIDNAVGCYEQSLDLARKLGDFREVHTALGNLGNAYLQQNRIDDAVTCYRQEHLLTTQNNDKHGQIKALRDLGTAYIELADLKQGKDYLEQSLHLAYAINDQEGAAIASWRLGLVLEQQGDLAQAVELMQVCVAYMGKIDHPDMETYAAYLTRLQHRLRESEEEIVKEDRL